MKRGIALALSLAILAGHAAVSPAAALVGCEVRGTPGNDVLVGSDRPEWMCGYGGNDIIIGGGGGDFIQGGDGDDWIRGSNGRDRIEGGPGDDLLEGDGRDDSIDGGPGNDVIRGGNGDDELIGGLGADVLEGGSGKDRLEGESGGDRLRGGPHADVLRGGPGDDILAGGPGTDTLNGGRGADRYPGADSEDVVVEPGRAPTEAGIGDTKGPGAWSIAAGLDECVHAGFSVFTRDAQQGRSTTFCFELEDAALGTPRSSAFTVFPETPPSSALVAVVRGCWLSVGVPQWDSIRPMVVSGVDRRRPMRTNSYGIPDRHDGRYRTARATVICDPGAVAQAPAAWPSILSASIRSLVEAIERATAGRTK